MSFFIFGKVYINKNPSFNFVYHIFSLILYQFYTAAAVGKDFYLQKVLLKLSSGGTSGVSVGNVSLVGHTGSFKHANIDRYYGESGDYIPENNKKVEIDMKRTTFGIKYATDLSEGSLKIALDGAPEVVINHPQTDHEDIYSFHYVQSVFTNNNNSETIPTTITWTKTDGVVVPLGTHNITFKRNVLTTVTIKVADVTTENGIGFELETTEMGTEDITIENGEIVDTNATPETGQ